MGPNYCWVKTNLGLKNVGPTNVLCVLKFVLVKKRFGSKKCWVQKNVGSKILDPKFVGLQKCLSKKKRSLDQK